MRSARWNAACLLAALAAGHAPAGEVRLNEMQVIGTHNSYHLAPHADMLGLLAVGGRGRAEGLDYTHRPLAEQFSEQGIRQIELDLFADPAGGLYAEPGGRNTLRKLGKDPGPDPDAAGLLRAPGMKVLHVPDVDYRSTVPTFAAALRAVRDWSREHPRHVPILVLVELKDGLTPGLTTRPAPFGKAELDQVDAEILAVFRRPEILTPDDLRGPSASLPEAIRGRGWPTLDSVRGRVLFALDNEDAKRDLYLDGHEALRGRLMFASVAPTDPAAAWFKVNDPVRDFDRIQSLVRSGFLVRTRADADTAEARRDDTARRDKALASGAQFVSTDYPDPDRRLSAYRVRLPGGVVARGNPLVGDPGRVERDLESDR